VEQFTKEEAFDLFGKTVYFHKTITFGDETIQIPLVEEGITADIFLITNEPDGISVSVLIDGDLVELDKESFMRNCQVMKSEIIHHARSV